MALKFRRGTTAQKSGSLAFGEPYVNTTLGTLQVGLDTGDVTLSALTTASNVSVNDITASGNISVGGNVAIAGQLTIGDQTSDVVNVVASLSSSLIPQTTNAFDLGSVTKIWRDLYISTGSIKIVDGSGNIVNTITNQNLVTTSSLASGSINLSASLPSGTVSGSEQVVSILTSINTYTGSNNIKWNTIGNLTGSYATTGSNVFKGPQTISSSIAELRLEDSVSGKAFHLRNYNGDYLSIHQGDGLSIFRIDSGSANGLHHTHLYGDLFVFSGSVSSSIGFSGSINGIGDVTTYSQSVNNRLTNLNSYTASNDITNTTQNTRLSRLEESTASLNSFSASQLTKDSTLQSYTASIDTKFSTLQTLTASVQSQISRIQESTASLNAFSASNGNTSLNSFTASINTTIKNRLDAETVISGSSQVTLSSTTGFTSYSSSVDSRILTEKGRVDAILLASDADKDSFAEIVTLINSVDTTNDNAFASFYTASVNRLNNLESTSASLAIETANLELFTSSINTTIKNKLNTDGVVSGSSQINFTQLSGISNGIVSGSSQLTPLLPTGTISGSTQLTSSYDGRYELQGRGVFSGSSQIPNSSITNAQLANNYVGIVGTAVTLGTTISAATIGNAIGAFSGSSQVDLTATTNYASGILTRLNAVGVVSGSSQVIGILSSLNTYTASNDTTNTTQNSRLDQLSTASGSAISRLTVLESETLNLERYTGSFATASVTLSNKTLITPTIAAIGGDEGGQIDFALAATNQTLTGSISFDIWRDRFRIFEGGGTNKGVFLQISSASATVGSEIIIDNGTQTLTNKTISGTSNTLSNIGNSSLTNSSITIAGQSTALGGIITTETIRTAIGAVVTGSSQVNFTQLSGISANIISASSDTSNVDMIISGGSISANLYGGVVSGSAQVVGMLASLNTYTASNDTTNTNQSNKLSRLEESTASLNAYTASNDTKWSTLGSLSGSFARTNSANVFTGNQTITGSLFITQDLIVGGSSSIQNITSSNLVIGAAYVTLNTNSPSSRFAGLQIIDSGSAGSSGSFLYDAVQDEFIFVHKGNGLNVTSSHFILGPETYDNLGNETYLTNNRVPKGSGKEHLNDSNITDTGTLITLGSNSVVNGTFYATGTTLVSGSAQIAFSGVTGTVSNAQLANSAITIAGQSTSLGGSVTADTIRAAIGTIVTGSSQISHDSTTGYSANRHIDHTAVSITAGSGLTGGGDISATRTISIATGGVTDSMLAGSISNSKLTNSSITIAGQSTALGSSVTAETIRTAIGTVVTGSAQIDLTATTNYATGILTRLNTVGVFSGSSQVSHDSTTGYSANRHVDHTAVSITAGSGLTGGGDISTTRTISIANLGVTDAMLAGSISNAKLSNSAITIAGQSTSLGGSVTAETIRTAIGTVVTGSAQIAIASTSGFGTYINQAVLTTSSPTFAGLTINGSITATGDITAYYTSDKRHKNNIQPIENALLKVSKLNGVTWEWNDDVHEVTKATPKTGLIAQEVQEVLPEVVREREDGFLSLDYSKMVGLLVEAIKEQQSQIHNLTLQVENLKKQKGL